MYRFFFGFFPFQKQPRSKCVFLCSPQILNFNSWIYITNPEAKRIPDACGYKAAPQRSARRAGADAPWRRSPAGPRRPNRPPGLQPAPHHRTRVARAPSRPGPPAPAAGRQTATVRPGCRGGNAAPAHSADPAARSWERKVWTRKYIACPHLGGNTGAINQGRRRQDTAPAPKQQVAARPVTSPPGPVLPPPWRSRFLPSPGCAAPSSPRRCSRARPGATSAVGTRAHTQPLEHSPGRGAGCLPPGPHGRGARSGRAGERVWVRVWRSVRGRGGGRGLDSVTSWGSAAAGHPGCARRGRAAQHIVSRRGDAARRGRGARAALGCRTGIRCRRRSAATARRGGGGRAGVGGPRGAAAAATPDCSTGALRQAAARAHLPAAAPGRTIGCPRGAREIELSIHSWACRARAAAAELSPGSLEDARCPPQPKGASPRGLWARTVSAAGSSRGGCERRGLSLGSRCALHGLLEDPQPAVPGLRLEGGSSETVRRYQRVSSARVESTNPLEVLGDNEFPTAVQSSE